MAQQGPNPIEVYQGVAQSIVSTLVSTFGNVNASQLSASTPCVEWTVQKLINHNINVQTFLHATLTGQTMDPGSMFQVDDPIPQEGAEAALKSTTDTVISAAQGMDLSTVVTTLLWRDARRALHDDSHIGLGSPSMGRGQRDQSEQGDGQCCCRDLSGCSQPRGG